MFLKNGMGQKVGTYALLDGGSTRHVVSEKLCRRLGIGGIKTKMCVTTLDHMMEGEREVADVEVDSTIVPQQTLEVVTVL